MNKVFMFIRTLLNNLYYTFYAFMEGVFRISKTTSTLGSVCSFMSLIIALLLERPLSSLALHWFGISFNRGDELIIDAILYLGGYCLSLKYFSPVHEEIEQRYHRDNLLKKIIYGMLGVGLIFESIKI